MPKYRVLIAEFPYGGTTHQTVGDWITDTVLKMARDPRIGEGNIFRWKVIDTPITMGRNRCLVAAEENNVDYVLMIDSDMAPDVRYAQQEDDDAKPFWDVAWEFAMSHDGPCVVAAPYCGPPPVENVYAFRFADYESRTPTPNFKLEQYSRFEAGELTGVKRVGAAATGLILIDVRGVKRLSHPRFYYEWTDERQVHKASTEDVTFTRDLNWAGCPVYVAWDSWAGHWKQKCVGRPVGITGEDVKEQLAQGKELARVRAARVSAAAADAPPAPDRQGVPG